MDSSGNLSAILGHISWPIILCLGVLYYIALSLYIAYLGPLAKYPGPTAAKFTRFWGLRVTFGKQGHHVYRELHDRYGPVVRIGPSSLSFDDAGAVKVIYGQNGKGGSLSFPRDAAFPAVGLNPQHLPVFMCLETSTHQVSRRKIGSAYTMTSILALEDRVDNIVALLRERLDEAATNGGFVDISNWVAYFAFDVISDLAYGQAFGCLATGNDVHGIIEGLQGGFQFPVLFNMFPWLFNGMHAIFGKAVEPKDDAGIGLAVKMAHNIVAERYQHPSEKRDLLNAFIAGKDNEGTPIHADQVRGEVIGTLVAGGDTTSLTTLGCLGYLLQHPQVLAKLKEELAGLDIPSPSYRQLQALPYLTAVIQEALRLSPAVGGAFTRQVPAGGSDILPGQFVPGGTVVSVNNWVFGRNKAFYGPDADQFRPERWLEDEERTKRMKNYDFSFGHGARVCIGRNLAMVELYKLVHLLASRYDIVPLDRHNLYHEELKLFLNKSNMMVKLKRVQ